MSFGKSFIVSLLTLIVLTPVMLLIAYAIGGNFDGFLSALTDFMYILFVLFSATAHSIWTVINQIIYSIDAPFNLLTLLVYLAFILAPLIAAIITGRLSENRVHSFVGFILSVIICMLVSLILVYSGLAYQIMIGGSGNQTQAIMNVVLGSLVNGVIYGLIAFITTKK